MGEAVAARTHVRRSRAASVREPSLRVTITVRAEQQQRPLRARFEGRSEILIGVRESTPVSSNRLQCVECGPCLARVERGWTARLTVDDEVVVYCPECGEREFGNEPRRTLRLAWRW